MSYPISSLELPEETRWFREQCSRLRDHLGALLAERDQLVRVTIPSLETEWLAHVGAARAAYIGEDVETRYLRRVLEALRSARQREQALDLEEVERQLGRQLEAWRADVSAFRFQAEKARLLLSLPSNVSGESFGEIRRLYRKLVRKLHPDVGGKEGDPRWLQVRLAYENMDLAGLQVVEALLDQDKDVEEPSFDWALEHARLESLIQRVADSIEELQSAFPLSLQKELGDPDFLLQAAESYRRLAEAEKQRQAQFREQIEALVR